jgi:single-strand DNA-binding protein
MSSRVTLQGRLTRDPEMRFTSSGTAVAQFAVVTVKRVKNGEVWEDQDVSFWDCTAFGQFAENIVESLEKGSSVIVQGMMRQESWTNKDGDKRTSWKVLADDVGISIKWKKPDNVGTKGSSSSRQPAAVGGFSADPPF